VPPTQFIYDAQGNLRTVTDPSGKDTTFTYNTAGQPLTIADPLGHTTTFTYDTNGNLATTADPLGDTTSFQYDPASRLTRQIDPGGRATAFAYDALNQIRTITDALGGVKSFTYDENACPTRRRGCIPRTRHSANADGPGRDRRPSVPQTPHEAGPRSGVIPTGACLSEGRSERYFAKSRWPCGTGEVTFLPKSRLE